MRSPLDPILFDLAAGRRLRQQSLTEETCHQVIEHKLGGLLLTRINEGKARVPAKVASALRSHDAMNRLAHSRQLRAVSKVSRALEEIDLPHLYINGFTTSERWYERIGERASADVDVVLSPLRPHKWLDAVAALDPHHPAAQGRVDPQDLLSDLALQLPLPGGIDLDVHFDTLRYGLPARTSAEMWRRRQSLKLSSGQEVAALDPEVALVQALIQLNRDGFRYLNGFADVSRILSAEEIDWAYLDDLVAREGIRVPTFASLRVVVEALDLPAPTEIKLDGWRRRLWSLAWPKRHRLQGDDGARRWIRGERLLAFLPGGRRLEAAKRWVDSFAPPRSPLQALGRGTSGRSLWRGLWPRLRQMRIHPTAQSRVERN